VLHFVFLSWSVYMFACLPLKTHKWPVNLMKMYISCYRHASVFSKIINVLNYICLCKRWQICISISRNSYLFYSFKTLIFVNVYAQSSQHFIYPYQNSIFKHDWFWLVINILLSALNKHHIIWQIYSNTTKICSWN